MLSVVIAASAGIVTALIAGFSGIFTAKVSKEASKEEILIMRMQEIMKIQAEEIVEHKAELRRQQIEISLIRQKVNTVKFMLGEQRDYIFELRRHISSESPPPPPSLPTTLLNYYGGYQAEKPPTTA